jgi:microtubule-associated protein-like 1/2
VSSQHHAGISAFDFSTDGTYLQSNDISYELLFSNDLGEYISQATSMKDVEWATQSCTLGWTVKGIWPKLNDGTVFNCADRSFEGEWCVCVCE